jgi:acyl carrier protein
MEALLSSDVEFEKKIVETFCSNLNIIKNTTFKPCELLPEQHLAGDLGFDSVETMELWFDLEQHFNIRIDDTDKMEVQTIRELIDLIVASLYP